MTTMVGHLSNEELEARYEAAADAVARSHFHALWLLSCGYEVEEVGAILSFSIGQAPLHGDIVCAPTYLCVYIPATNYHGTDSFTYVASDGLLSSTPAEVNVTVRPVNDAPASAPQTVTFTNQGPAPVTILGVAAGGNDPNQAAPFSACGDPQSLFPTCDFVTKNQAGAVNNCTPPSTLQDSCSGQAIAPGGSCKVDFVYCPGIVTGAFPTKEFMQIMTDELDPLGQPTADSTRVPVQLDGQAN